MALIAHLKLQIEQLNRELGRPRSNHRDLGHEFYPPNRQRLALQSGGGADNLSGRPLGRSGADEFGSELTPYSPCEPAMTMLAGGKNDCEFRRQVDILGDQLNSTI